MENWNEPYEPGILSPRPPEGEPCWNPPPQPYYNPLNQPQQPTLPFYIPPDAPSDCQEYLYQKHFQLARRRLGSISGILLLYTVIMYACIFLVSGIVSAYYMLRSPNLTEYELWEILSNNGWGYVLTVSFGMLLVLIWKKKPFFKNIAFTSHKPMTVGTFFSLFAFFLLGQVLFSIFDTIVEQIFNLFGLSVMTSIESATSIGRSFSMLLYGCVLAPITEEIIFRGAVMRTMQPYGRRFAILFSAILFGAFHGNLVQAPFAFAVGLVMGYTAMEYSIWWAILLHFVNNCILGEALPFLSNYLPFPMGEILQILVLFGGAMAGIVLCIVKWPEIKGHFQSEKISGTSAKAIMTSPWTIIFLVLMFLSSLLGITVL